MAFGIDRQELRLWKKAVKGGDIAFLTHYWLDSRFPNCYTVTKVGCNNLNLLIEWGKKYGLQSKWIDQHHTFPHFDLFGKPQSFILTSEQQWDQISRFKIKVPIDKTLC